MHNVNSIFSKIIALQVDVGFRIESRGTVISREGARRNHRCGHTEPVISRVGLLAVRGPDLELNRSGVVLPINVDVNRGEIISLSSSNG